MGLGLKIYLFVRIGLLIRVVDELDYEDEPFC